MMVNLKSAREEKFKKTEQNFVRNTEAARDGAVIVLHVELFNLPRPPSTNTDNDMKENGRNRTLQRRVS